MFANPTLRGEVLLDKPCLPDVVRSITRLEIGLRGDPALCRKTGEVHPTNRCLDHVALCRVVLTGHPIGGRKTHQSGAAHVVILKSLNPDDLPSNGIFD